jgi:hypothetical protein
MDTLRTPFLTCVLLLTALVGRGQPTEWFPVGATWSCIQIELKFMGLD